MTAEDVGGALLDAFAFIERTGPLELSLEEQENCWRHDTKYKTYRSFARNNDFLQVSVERGKPYFVCAYPPRTSDLVGDEGWKGTVPAGASAEELGDAVMDAYAAIDEVEESARQAGRGREPVARSVALCDGGEVLLPGPGEGFAERTSAAGEVLLAFERTGRGGIPWHPCTWPRRSGTRRRTAGRRGTSGWSAGRGITGLRARSRASRAGGPVHPPLGGAQRLVSDGRAARARPDGLAVMLCLDAARPGRRPKAVGRWEEELHRIARAATIRPGKTES